MAQAAAGALSTIAAIEANGLETKRIAFAASHGSQYSQGHASVHFILDVD
jgi:hypothetical protein